MGSTVDPRMKPRRPWAVLAYAVADDSGASTNIDNAAKRELVALCAAAGDARFEHLSVAAQVDFKFDPGIFRASINPPFTRGEFVPVPPDRLWRKIERTLPESATLELLKNADDTNAARGDVLQSFIRYGSTECPADRQVIFFYGHACGPMGLFYDEDARQRVANTMRLNDLADAIGRGDGERPAAVVMFRDCFMSCLEAAYQLQHVTTFMIASQSVVPIAGVWPWPAFVDALKDKPTTEAHARALLDALAAFLDDEANRHPFADAPISLLDLGQAERCVSPLTALTNVLHGARGTSSEAAYAAAIEGARGGFPDDPSRPGDPALVDVLTLCERLQALTGDAVAIPAAALSEAVQQLVKAHRSQAAGSPYRGVSLYCKPQPENLERSHIEAGSDTEAADDAASYRKLALVAATGWWHIALEPLRPAQ